jgi:hypothetical protein
MKSIGLDGPEMDIEPGATISISPDVIEAEAFAGYLISLGYRAQVGNESVSRVDGIIHELADLYHDYCDQ